MVKKLINGPKKNVFSFSNMKGGVGKTTLCANLGYTLANLGYSVLLIDMDPQFNLSSLYLEEKVLFDSIRSKNNVFQIFNKTTSLLDKSVDDEIRNKEISEKIIMKNVKHINIDIIPGTIDLFNIAEESSISIDLQYFLVHNDFRNIYDFIFIDCPPTKGKYLTVSLKASDYYIIPVKPDFLSTIGIELFNKQIDLINKTGTTIELFSIIFTMVNENTNHHTEKMNEIRNDYLFNTSQYSMRHSFKVPEYAANGTFIYDFNSLSATERRLVSTHADDIIDLANEFINKYNASQEVENE